MISDMKGGWCISIKSSENDADFVAENFIWGITTRLLLEQFLKFFRELKKVDKYNPDDDQIITLCTFITPEMARFVGYEIVDDETLNPSGFSDFMHQIGLNAMNYEYYQYRKIDTVEARYIPGIVTRDKAYFILDGNNPPYGVEYPFMEQTDDNDI